MLEEYFRRALLMTDGHFSVFVTQPISATLLGVIVVFVARQLAGFFLRVRRREKAALA